MSIKKLHIIESAIDESTVSSSLKKNNPSDRFEKRIRDLFKSLDFKKINGGSNFMIGGNQVDACGICEDKLIICECTTQRGNIKSKITAYNGLRSSIKRNISEIPEYREYAKKDGIVFLFASKYNFDFDKYKDITENAINFWTSADIKYYEDIAKNVKSRARYDVLADLGCTITNLDSIKVPAFRIAYNNIEMFSFFAKPEELIKVSYVARRESGKQNYYQRMLEPRRLVNITRFLKKGGVFPTNIVVGISGKPEFDSINNKSLTKEFKQIEMGILTLPKSYQGCWVIDGQHRLFSFEPGMKQRLQVLALYNLNLTKQANFFVEINKEAKPVPSGLIWDLCGDLDPTGSDGRISRAVKLLNTESDCLRGKISIPSQGNKGRIKMTTFCETLKKIGFGKEELKTGITKKNLTKNPFYNNDPEKHIKNIFKGMEDYYSGIDCFINEKNKFLNDFLFDNGGVSVFLQLYRVLISIEDKKINETIFEKYIEPIINYMSTNGPYKVKEYKRKCSSEVGKSDVLTELLEIIKDKDPKINWYIAKNDSLEKKFSNFESKLRNYVSKKLKNDNFENIKNNVGELTKNVEKRLKKGDQLNLNNFCNALTLGNLKTLIVSSQYLWRSKFKNIFIKDGLEEASIEDIRYPSENIFISTFEFVISARNIVQHGKSNIPRKDEKRIDEFMDTVSVIVEKDSLSFGNN